MVSSWQVQLPSMFWWRKTTCTLFICIGDCEMKDRFPGAKTTIGTGRTMWARQWRQVTLCLISAAALLSLLAEPATARSAPESFADLAQKLLPAVVNISTTSATKAQEGAPQLPQFPPGSPFEDFFREYFEKTDRRNSDRRLPLGPVLSSCWNHRHQ